MVMVQVADLRSQKLQVKFSHEVVT